jgi:hypothetical protein
MIPCRLHRTNVLEPVVSPVSGLPTTRKVTVEIDQTIALKISPSAFIDSVQSGPRQVVRNGPARLMSPVKRSMLASLSICEL